MSQTNINIHSLEHLMKLSPKFTTYLNHKTNINIYNKIGLNVDILWDDNKINKNRNNRKLINLWKLNNSLLTETWDKVDTEKKLHNSYSSMKINTACPNLRNKMKVLLLSKLIAMHAYIFKKKQKKRNKLDRFLY